MNWIFKALAELWEAVGTLFSWSLFLLLVMLVIELIFVGKEWRK